MRRTSPSRPAAGSRPRASSSTTTPTGRCRTRARSTTSPPGGGYSVSETVPAGWDLRAQPAMTAARSRTSPCPLGETVTCTFTNHKRGQIVVVKDARPDDPQDFSFTAGGGLSPTSFQLDDDSNGTLSNTRTFTDVPAGAGYSLAETVPRGWDQTSATCNDGSPVSNIDVAPGETVTCTFTNRKRGQIVVIGRGAGRPAGLLVHRRRRASRPRASSSTTTRRRRSSNTPHVQRRPGRVRLLARRDRADRLGSRERHLQRRQPGLEHRGVGRRDGHLHVHEPQAGPDRGRQGRDAQRPAGLLASPPAAASRPTSFQLDDDANADAVQHATFTDVRPGPATRWPRRVPAGWDQLSATCNDGSPVSNIDVGPAEIVTCTFTNRKRGRIVVVKDAAARRPAGLRLHGRRRPVADRASSSTTTRTPRCRTRRTFADRRAGRGYSLAETVPAGWDQASATCDDGSPVSNIDVCRGRDRHLHVHEPQARPDRDRQGRASRTTRRTSPSRPAAGCRRPASASTTTPTGRSRTRAPSPTVAPGGGYSRLRDRAHRLGPDRARPATTAARRRTSRSRAGRDRHLHLHEPQARADRGRQGRDAQRPAGLRLHRRRRPLARPSFDLDDDADATLSNTHTFTDVLPGSGYSLAETVPSRLGPDRRHLRRRQPGVRTSTWPRARPSPARSTNRKRGQIVVTKDAVPNDAQDFAFTAGGGLSPASFSLDDDSDPALSNTRTFDERAGRLRLLARRDRAQRLGSVERDLQRRQPGFEHQRVRR